MKPWHPNQNPRFPNLIYITYCNKWAQQMAQNVMSDEIILFKTSKSVPFNYSHVTLHAPKPQLLKPQASVLRCYILSKTSSASHFSHSLQNCSTLDLRDWAAATRLLNSNSWFFNVSHSIWICCNCTATACLLDSFFKRSHSLSSCLFLFLNLSQSDWSCCICNACSCLWDSSFKRSDSFSSCFFLRCSHSSLSSCNFNATARLSFKRSDSCSSCLFLKLSHSSWSCRICDACSCLLDSSSFKRVHSCVNCCTWMWTLCIGKVIIKVLARPSVARRIGRSLVPRHHHGPFRFTGPTHGPKPWSHGALWRQFHVSPFFTASSTSWMASRRARRAAATCPMVTVTSRSILCIFSSLDSFKKKSRSSTCSGEELWRFRDLKEWPQLDDQSTLTASLIACSISSAHPRSKGLSRRSFSAGTWTDFSFINLGRVGWLVRGQQENDFSVWGDSVFLKCQEIPFGHPTLVTLFPRSHGWGIMEEIACSSHIQMTLASEIQREESAKSQIQKHDKCVKACSIQYMSVLLQTRPHGLMLAWANHLAHFSTLPMSVTANIWDTSQNMLFMPCPLVEMQIFRS